MKTKKKEDAVRDQVADAYTKAIRRVRDRGQLLQRNLPRVGVALWRRMLKACSRPKAVESSFGCGNPVALAGIGEGDVVLDLGSGAGLDLILVSQKRGTVQGGKPSGWT